MPTALFIILPYPSHYLPTFGMARALQRLGYQLVFVGTPDLQDLVEGEGFIFEPLAYHEEYKISSFKIFAGLVIKNLLNTKNTQHLYKDFYKSIQSSEGLVEKYRPSQIFLDDHLAHYFLYLKKYNAPITMISTKFSTKKKNNIPPLDSDFVPSNSVLSKLFTEYLWFIHLSKLRWKTWLEKLVFLGKDDEFFQRRYCKKNKINYKQIINKHNAFYVGLSNVPTIILAPERAEFLHKNPLSSEFYLNLPIKKDESAYFSDEYEALVEKIQFLKNTKVIYCAFGTLPNTAYFRVISFLNKIVNVVAYEEVLLVISTGGLSVNIPFYSHIHVFPFLPQLDMLKHCDLMITHGGLGSIKECLQAGVQMLVYPSHLGSDQKGNAARVEANSFGLRGDMEKDSEVEILRKIKLLLTRPFRNCSEVDSEEKVMELLTDLGIEVPKHLLTQ